MYLGSNASEECFYAEAPGSRVAHLATHGYYLEDECQPEVSLRGLGSEFEYVGENPLLLSGLLLAGANLHGLTADSLGTEDGILTALEISGRDFAGTDLVVLSSCETGLGEASAGEGVFGLRRAFLLAGARVVLSALWPVSDRATAELMEHLYATQEGSLPEVMRAYAIAKIAQLRRLGIPDHPYHWAPFIATRDRRTQ